MRWATSRCVTFCCALLERTRFRRWGDEGKERPDHGNTLARRPSIAPGDSSRASNRLSEDSTSSEGSKSCSRLESTAEVWPTSPPRPFRELTRPARQDLLRCGAPGSSLRSVCPSRPPPSPRSALLSLSRGRSVRPPPTFLVRSLTVLQTFGLPLPLERSTVASLASSLPGGSSAPGRPSWLRRRKPQSTL